MFNQNGTRDIVIPSRRRKIYCIKPEDILQFFRHWICRSPLPEGSEVVAIAPHFQSGAIELMVTNPEFEPVESGVIPERYLLEPLYVPRSLQSISDERTRQVLLERFDDRHDDEHTKGEIGQAAACYAAPPENGMRSHDWPWDLKWWKPSLDDSIQGRIKELVKAGALIVAEIDRLERLERKQRRGTESDGVNYDTGEDST